MAPSDPVGVADLRDMRERLSRAVDLLVDLMSRLLKLIAAIDDLLRLDSPKGP